MKLFPSRSQFRHWTIPSKASFLGLLGLPLGVIGIGFAVYVYLFSYELIKQSDFKAQLMLQIHQAAIDNFTPPNEFTLFSRVGDTRVRFFMRLIDSTSNFQSVKNPVKSFQYISQEIVIELGQKVRNTVDLYNAELSAQIPFDVIGKRDGGLVSYQLQLFVLGELYLGNPDERGRITIVLA